MKNFILGLLKSLNLILKNDSIVEIASNDGTLLKFFLKKI